MKIALTGGGTGGHIYPSLALLPDLQKHFDKIFYVGSDGIEKNIVPKFDLPFYSVDAIKFQRKLTIENLKIPYKLHKSKEEAKLLLKKLEPDVIFAKGGYVTLPTAFAAHDLQIPIVCHESDQSLGLANKICKMLGATVLCASKDLSKKNPDFLYTGLPIRKELYSMTPFDAKRKIRLEGKTILLVLGGSSGAKIINDFVYQNISKLSKDFFVVHISGKNGDMSKLAKNYLQYPYLENIVPYLIASDIIISRAGATAIAEISAIQKNCILIPLPKGVSRGDQLLNAQSAKKYGFSVINQNDLSIEKLLSELQKQKNAPCIRCNNQNANKKICDILVEQAKEYNKTKSLITTLQ